MQKNFTIESIKKILLNDWDPIGAREILEAQDEYDLYAPKVYKILLESGCINDLFNYLKWVEEIHMGLPSDGVTAWTVAKKLSGLIQK